MKPISLSFEFFPPRSDAQQRKFWHTLGCLQTLNPEYISVTWGALGSSSQASIDVLTDLVKECRTPITAHLSCAGQTETQMLATIALLEQLGISRFLALRGDGGHTANVSANGEPVLQHASDLVSLLASKPGRDICVAAYPEGHPESPNIHCDLAQLKHKLNAGATRAITQFFFEAQTFLRFRDNARQAGITALLVPGILPIHDMQKVMDFSSKCGASVPMHLINSFKGATTAESRRSAAIEQCVSLCEELRREGVDEFHLYTLNQSDLSYAISCELSGRAPGSVVAA